MISHSAIKLHYKQSGSGPVLLILHGLFGSLDNWQTIAGLLTPYFNVYTLDLRNHGKSPHTNEFSISLMAADVIRFIEDHALNRVNIAGHSMGGKVVLNLLSTKNTVLDKAMILDIAPKAYPKGHESIFNAMFALDLQTLTKRSEAEDKMVTLIPERTVRQFILKNLQSIFDNYNEINKEIVFNHQVLNEVVFVKGSLSKYILNEDEKQIIKSLPNAKFIEVEGAGHWIHADKPMELMKIMTDFFCNR
jgi:esterase